MCQKRMDFNLHYELFQTFEPITTPIKNNNFLLNPLKINLNNEGPNIIKG